MPNDDRTATTKCQDALSQERVKRKRAEDKLDEIEAILNRRNEDDVVLDIFAGSGTTAKMRIINNRDYVFRDYIYIDESEE